MECFTNSFISQQRQPSNTCQCPVSYFASDVRTLHTLRVSNRPLARKTGVSLVCRLVTIWYCRINPDEIGRRRSIVRVKPRENWYYTIEYFDLTLNIGPTSFRLPVTEHRIVPKTIKKLDTSHYLMMTWWLCNLAKVGTNTAKKKKTAKPEKMQQAPNSLCFFVFSFILFYLCCLIYFANSANSKVKKPYCFPCTIHNK